MLAVLDSLICTCALVDIVVSFEKQDSSGSKGFGGFGCLNRTVRKRIS